MSRRLLADLGMFLLGAAIGYLATLALSVGRDVNFGDARLDRLEHRLDRLEHPAVVRSQGGEPSEPSTTRAPRGACVVVQGRFEMWTSEQDAAGKPRCGR